MPFFVTVNPQRPFRGGRRCAIPPQERVGTRPNTHWRLSRLVAVTAAVLVLVNNHGAQGFFASSSCQRNDQRCCRDKVKAPMALATVRQGSFSMDPQPRFSRNSAAVTRVSMSSIEFDADPVASLEQLNDLVPRAEITPLVKAKSNLQGLLQMAWHFGMFAASACLIPQAGLSMLAMAFVASFFFTGLHECVHRTAFASTRLNDLIAQVFGFLCLRPAIHYRYYHWQHHKYTGNKELDSELQAGSFLDFPVNSLASYLFYLSGIPFWIDAVTTTVQHARGICPEMYLHKDKARRQVTLEARIYVVLYAALGGLGCAVPIVGRALRRYWILPALLGQPFLRFYLLTEHRGRATTPLIYENTRTMTTNGFYRKLAWNMPYHTAHHAWPSVPFYKLPQAHQLLCNAAAKSDEKHNLLEQGEGIAGGGAHGYLRFHASFLRQMGRRRSKPT